MNSYFSGGGDGGGGVCVRVCLFSYVCDGADMRGVVCVAGSSVVCSQALCVLQEVQRFAIKEKTTAVSANQESGLFCSSRQNLSTLSSSSLSSNLMHPYLYSVTRAARNTSIAHSQNTSQGNKLGEMCFLARFKYGFLNNHKTN